MKPNPKGKLAEAQARDFLASKGYRFVEANFHCPFGEIDLIFRDGEQWVFVEVKARASERQGGARYALSSSKLSRIRTSIEVYVQAKQLTSFWGRIDLVAITGDVVEHVVNVDGW